MARAIWPASLTSIQARPVSGRGGSQLAGHHGSPGRDRGRGTAGDRGRQSPVARVRHELRSSAANSGGGAPHSRTRLRSARRRQRARLLPRPAGRVFTPRPAAASRVRTSAYRPASAWTMLASPAGHVASATLGHGGASAKNAACTRGHQADSGSMTSKCPEPDSSSNATSSPAARARAR